MKTAEYWIDKLKLEKHPEGGYFREIYRSDEEIPATGLPSRYEGKRAFSTSIYYLLRSGEFSAFHRLKSDEIWHFYAGTSLRLFIITPEGEIYRHSIGNNPDQNEQLQVVIPRGNWFAASVALEGSYTLMGCTVAPGFDFGDFELGKRNELIEDFPSLKEIITAYTIQ